MFTRPEAERVGIYNGDALPISRRIDFTFERETLELMFLGKAASVFYWANGQYWQIATAD